MTTAELAQPTRRLLANATDPTFQGDGWRWTLSLFLPWRLRVLVLTEAQYEACYLEWKATQEQHAGRPLTPFELALTWK